MATKSNKYTQNTEQGIKSAREKTIDAKEFLRRNKSLRNILSSDKCGLDNPCVFGKKNPNFNKNNL